MLHAPLVGRDRELAVAHEAMVAADGGAGSVLLIEGEAGIGKSRLLDEVRSRGLARGAQVLDAGCEELEQSVPFAAVRRLFDLNMEMPRPAGESLGASSRGGDHADLSHGVAPTSQFRTMAAFASRVDRLATDGTILLILDDLQWADPASLRTLASLAVRIGHLPVLLLTAARMGHGSAHLHRLNDEFLRAGVVRLELGPLDDDEVATLAQELLGTQLPIALLSRLQGAAGNPLFVTEFVRHLGHAGFDVQDQVAGANEPLPREFRLGVLRRLAQLDSNVQDVVRVASVLGSSFLARDLATVADRPLVELLPLLGHAVDAGVLEARGDALAFRHGLVREAVYEHIAPGVRRDLHREVGWRLADTEADLRRT